jgi:hypothetical protein
VLSVPFGTLSLNVEELEREQVMRMSGAIGNAAGRG